MSSAPTASWPTSVWKRSSSSIDSDGFLVEIFDVIDACDDESLRLNLHRRMRVRQVPGDGSCLFHSITAALALVVNGSHHPMDVHPLRSHSKYLRDLAVDILEREGDRTLWLQGREKMTSKVVKNPLRLEWYFQMMPVSCFI